MDQQGQMILELWRMFLRHLRLLIGVGVIGVCIAGFIAYVLPPVYVSEAKILVESQQIPSKLAQSTVTTGAGERLQLIQQRLLARDNLVKVIESQNLFENRADLSISERIELLRDATEFRSISLSGRRRSRAGASISAFTISVRLSDPNKASGVANEFVTTVLSENISAREKRASETLEFFQREEQRLAKALNDHEVELTRFKRDNEQALPESLQFRRDQLNSLANGKFQLEQQMIEFEEARYGLALQLQRLENAPAHSPASGAAGPEAGQIRLLEAQLAQKRVVFSENHREVRLLKAQIEALRSSLPEQAGASGETAIDIEMSAVRRQLDLLNTQIKLVSDQLGSFEERRAALEASIEATPQVELEMNSLRRRHTELQDQYLVIVKKRAAAETGEKLEINQQAERFEVIENARVPEKPVSPNRGKIFALGSGVSLVLAGGIAFLLEILHPALRSASQMERKLELRPVVTIPYIRTKSERRRRRFWAFLLIFILFVGAPAALYLLDAYYLPLQLIIERVIDQLGLGEIIMALEQRL